MTMRLCWKGLCPPLDTPSQHGWRGGRGGRGGGETFWEHFVLVQDRPQKWSWWQQQCWQSHFGRNWVILEAILTHCVFSPFCSDSWQEGREAPVVPDNHPTQQNANEVSYIEPGQRRVANKTSPPLWPFSSGLWNLNLNLICQQVKGFFLLFSRSADTAIDWLTLAQATEHH